VTRPTGRAGWRLWKLPRDLIRLLIVFPHWRPESCACATAWKTRNQL